MANMNPKWQRFAEEYLVDLNATAAYKRAGYKAIGNAAETAAARLLRNVQVQEFIQAGREKASKKTLVTVEFVINGLKDVAQRCMQRVPVMVGQGKERRQATVEIEDPKTGDRVTAGVWEFDSSGANRSLELLGKHVGAFIESDSEDLPMPTSVTVNVINGRKPE